MSDYHSDYHTFPKRVPRTAGPFHMAFIIFWIGALIGVGLMLHGFGIV